MLLLEVEMTATDPHAAGDFYAETLGLPVERHDDRVVVTAGTSTLTLRAGPGASGSHHLALTVPVDRFDEARRRLAGRAPLLRRDGADEFALPAPWRSRSVYVAGPDGALLELIARRDLEPLARPGNKAVVSISEVGVAVPDVEAAATLLRDTLGLARFDTGGPGFVPVGDHQGLLILVAPGRTWFPTADLVPSAAPVTVVLGEAPRPSAAPLVLGRCTVVGQPA